MPFDSAADPKLLVYSLEWLIRFGALAIVPQRRSPTATASWLLAIFFLPIPGLAVYLLIGRPAFPEARVKRQSTMRPFLVDLAARLDGAAGGDAGEAGRFASTLGRMPAVGGNAIELIDDYDAVVDRLVADIDAAARRVDLLVYIFADDAVGRRVADALGRARLRGVACRVMFDPIGSHAWRRRTLAMLRAADVDVREALPVRLFRRRTRADMRNHRKLFVVDGEIGYAGSQNLVVKDFRPGVENRELVARTTGPVVAEMMGVVANDWAMEGPGPPTPDPVRVPGETGGSVLQLLPSGADFPLEGFETLLTWLIHVARERVVLVTPYFVPDEDVVGAMRSACARGIEVHLVVSQVVDQRLVHLAQCSYFDALLAAGVRIHRYRRFLLHAKNATIDGRLGVVGSSNVDLRSFQLNEEASLLLHGEEDVERLAAVQRGYVEDGDELLLEDWRKRSRLRRMAENVARLFSPLL